MWISRLDVILLVVQTSSFITGSCGMFGVLDLKHFKILLSTSKWVLTSSPVVVKLSSNFSISLLDIGLLHERMLQKLRPSESFVRSFIQKTLKEGLELWRHIFWELYWILYDQMDQCVDTICVKRWSSFEQFVNNYTK
jgi:hypothetical protein